MTSTVRTDVDCGCDCRKCIHASPGWGEQHCDACRYLAHDVMGLGFAVRRFLRRCEVERLVYEIDDASDWCCAAVEQAGRGVPGSISFERSRERMDAALTKLAVMAMEDRH